MGESSGAEISVFGSELESFSVETPGDRIQIRWDCEARAIANAQRSFLAEFLGTTGAYDAWLNSCPLSCCNCSGDDQHKQDLLGNCFLPILVGHHRYFHITALRSDGASPRILGMSKIASENVLRRALARMSATESRGWLRPAASFQCAGRSGRALDSGYRLFHDSGA
jgi:hypothetical protein